MPQASRSGARASNVEKDAATKAQEQEFKRARGAISCAECRRLKLKCDKTVPCGSCRRRGCESICPNGSLTTGQGTRFILADTDRLHKKITEMSDRIRQLEDALAILQSSTTRDMHPLLRPDLLGIKSGLELHSAINHRAAGQPTPQDVDEQSQQIDVPGTLNVRDDGAARFYGHSAGSESLLLVEEDAELALSPSPALDMGSLHPHIDTLANAFPAAPTTLGLDSSTLQSLVTEHLPEWPRAKQLCDLYLEQAPWFFGAITRRQLLEELLPLFYGEALDLHLPDTPSASSPESSDNSPAPTLVFSKSAFVQSSSGKATPHELALMFVVFCFGALTDPLLPPAPGNTEASTYYQLTRAALNIEPVLDGPPSVATVQTLSLMGIYQGLVADENSIETTWALMGLSCKLAQSVGLHRDCARWKLTPAEVQKRRALFWELFITDCWQALATGRLPSFSLPFVDAELPGDPEQTLDKDGNVQPSFAFWKATWGKECVSAVVEVTLTSRAPKYSLILELDRKIRDMPLPNYALEKPPKGASLSATMKHFMPLNYRELTLLYVHRCYFAQALKDHPKDPLRSQYAPSFLAGYRSACALVAAVREQFDINPVQIARFWVLWTHAFSSTVMLASVVTRGGTTKTAQAAFGELRLAYALFQQAAKYGGRAVKFLPVIEKLYHKASTVFYGDYNQPAKDIFSERSRFKEEEQDELSIFSGRTRTVSTKAPRQPSPHTRHAAAARRISPNVTSPAVTEASSSSSGSGSMRASQSPTVTSPAQTPDDMPALTAYGTSVHPMLIDEMRTFEGQLDAQIHNAEQQYHLVHNSAPEKRPRTGEVYTGLPGEGYHHYTPAFDQSPQEPQWREPELAPLSIPVQRQDQLRHAELPQSFQQQQQQQYQQQHHLTATSYYESQPVADGGAHSYPTPPSNYSPVAASPVVQQPEVASYHSHPAHAPNSHAPSYVLTSHPSHQPQSEYWHTPVTPTEFHPHAGMLHDAHGMGPYPPSHQPSPTSHARPPNMLGYPAYYAPQMQPQPMQPQPMSSVLPVHAGGPSLQETWTSFMQHELPAPPAQGFQRR